MLTKLLLSKWKEILAIIILAGSLYFIYDAIYDRGYNASETKWVEKEQSRANFIEEQLTRIEGFAKTNLEHTLIANESVRKDISNIKLKGSPTTIIKGDCIPSEEFITTYNKMIDRSNHK